MNYPRTRMILLFLPPTPYLLLPTLSFYLRHSPFGSIVLYMLLTYSSTPHIIETIDNLMALRQSILLSPLSPRTELRLTFEVTINRIHASLILSDIETDVQLISDTLLSRPKVPSKKQTAIIEYSNALQAIETDWKNNSKPISYQAVLGIITSSSQYHTSDRLPWSAEADIRELLSFFDTSVINPFLKAAIASHLFLVHPAFSEDKGRIGRLVAHAVISHGGMDVRGLLAPEIPWVGKESTVTKALKQSTNDNTLTPWIETYLLLCLASLTKTIEELKEKKFTTSLPVSFFDLTERQKEIVKLSAHPEATITNGSMQKRYSISQITASRDLSRLVGLGLLFPHGKGRSIYYTKV